MSDTLSAPEIAERALRKERNARAFLKLEAPICELENMIGIVADMVFDLLDGMNRTVEGDKVIIRMNERQLNQVLFAVDKAHDMAADLRKTF